jgi:hypothetical protein
VITKSVVSRISAKGSDDFAFLDEALFLFVFLLDDAENYRKSFFIT